jgi:hypothetical protein
MHKNFRRRICFSTQKFGERCWTEPKILFVSSYRYTHRNAYPDLIERLPMIWKRNLLLKRFFTFN